MSVTGIIIAAAVIGIVGIIVGFGLGIFGEKFKVEVDERQIRIREVLPGNNCGGCGYPGCDGCAEAINKGEAKISACPVGGKACWDQIAAIMGVEAGEEVTKVAFVRCAGDCNKAPKRYIYTGPDDCNLMASVPGAGDKACLYGCLGHGSCVKACQFDAIEVVDGVARVNPEKCTGCGACAKACPKHIIDLLPSTARYRVKCSSKDRGKAVMDVCSAGCIACGLCEKTCPNKAITMGDNRPHFDYDKCVGCGKCAEKCPKKIIRQSFLFGGED